ARFERKRNTVELRRELARLHFAEITAVVACQRIARVLPGERREVFAGARAFRDLLGEQATLLTLGMARAAWYVDADQGCTKALLPSLVEHDVVVSLPEIFLVHADSTL